MTNECFMALSKCVSKCVEAFERQKDACLTVAAEGMLAVLRVGIRICTDSYMPN